jgi:alkaline phosphatase
MLTDRWMRSARIARARPGLATAIATAALLAGLAGGATAADPGVLSPAGDSPATILIAGDIATCTGEGDAATARLLSGRGGIVMTAGDNVYPSGTLESFQACYHPTWGRYLDRTRPALGNHDRVTPAAEGYFQYFGDRAGPAGRGYYAFGAGAWRVYVLDTNRCFLGGERSSCGPGSTQHRWLARQLERHPTPCSLAVGHHPRFSSGPHGNSRKVQPLLTLLYRNGGEVVVNGHDHVYERFAPARPDGTPDATRGIRQFIVGTGGGGLYGLAETPAPNSEFRSNRSYGVLRLRLAAGSYEWAFLRTDGTVADRGAGQCHGPVPAVATTPGEPATSRTTGRRPF